MGWKGEQLALDYLLGEKFDLLKRNFSNKFGEIDLIMKEGETIVFVEVKTKIGDNFGLPEEMVSAGKLGRIRKMAEVFLIEEKMWGCPCRIDVVAIVLGNKGEVIRLTHYENVG